jgi:hypothetical protein
MWDAAAFLKLDEILVLGQDNGTCGACGLENLWVFCREITAGRSRPAR